MSIQEELGSSRKALGLVLLCTLMVVYGGMNIPYGEGTWFHEEFEFVSSSISTSNHVLSISKSANPAISKDINRLEPSRI